jgi:hypothetical protein
VKRHGQRFEPNLGQPSESHTWGHTAEAFVRVRLPRRSDPNPRRTALTPRYIQRPSALVLGLLTLSVLSLAGIAVPGLADADVKDLGRGQWSGGV